MSFRASIPVTTSSLLFALFVGSLAPNANAQWSNDPAVNFALGDSASDQNQPKVAPTSDGGAWVSWFDGIGSGWDVRIQKLDVAGNEVFAHNGILVGDRGFSSTQDYGLDVAPNGDALLTFRDDSMTGIQITAARVTTAGTLAWGATGVQLTNTTSFVASPRIAGTSDGGAVVAWTEDASARVQKLDAAGAPQWGAGLTLTPGAGSYSPADVQDTGNDAIVSMVHQTGNFLSPKHIVTQKFDSTGAALWGAMPVAVFDGGSLQIGNFPSFVTDGAGGGVFSWYSSSPLQCYVQRIDSAGAELFPHNGVTVSTNAAQIRTDPSAAFDATSGDTFVFWVEQNGAQSMRGVSGQRIDSLGNRLWTANGATVVPLSSNDRGLVRTVVGGTSGGALAIWADAPSFGTDQLFAAHLDSTGTMDVGPVSVASTPSGKSRLAAGKSSVGSGFAILAWNDARTDGGDIYVQNVHFDGTLGDAVGLGTDHCNGDGGDQLGCTDCPCGNNAPMGTIGGCLNSASTSARLLASGDPSVSLPSGSTTDLRFALSGAPATAFCILNSGDAVAPQGMANPCFGLNSGSQASAFDGLRCAVMNTRRHGGRSADASGDVGVTNSPWGGEGAPPVGLALAGGGFVSGQTRYFQVINRDDPLSVCLRGLNTSQAVEITFTP